MKRSALLMIGSLLLVSFGSPSAGQSMRDIVKESEGGHMPTRNEFESRAGGHFLRDPEAIRQHSERYYLIEQGDLIARGTTACLPPGVSLDGLTIIGERHVKAPVDDGSFLQVVANAWGHGETSVVVLYWLTRQGVPSVLAAVDDDPTGPGKPWVDSTLVRLDGVVITGGHPSCAWKRVGSPAPERL